MNRAFFLTIVMLAGGWMVILPADLHAAQQLFVSPDEAAKALQVAVEDKNRMALSEIFGPKVRELLTGDQVQDEHNTQKFAAAMAQGYTLVKESDSKITLEVGVNNWPMPIPLVKVNGQWYFDTAAGQNEIINRHIGKDELHAIGVCRAFVKGQGIGPQPFHGYYFKILTRQSLVAYPAHWDHSGIMTFIVNQDGKVYQQNLGIKTSQIARAMKKYDPQKEWALIEDEGISPQ